MWTRNLLLMITLSATGSVTPGCVPTSHAVEDRSVPHRLSRPASVYQLERLPDGSSVEERVDYETGSVIAHPGVVDK